MRTLDDDSAAEPPAMLGATVPLAAVRRKLKLMEALEREVATRAAGV